MRLRRRRTPSKTTSVGLDAFFCSSLAPGAGAGEDAGVAPGVGEGVGVAEGSGAGVGVGLGGGLFSGRLRVGARVRGVSSRKRSRNWSSRKRGVRGMRSTRASWLVSVRCPVSKRRNVPSGLHETVLVLTLARKLTGCGPAPPSTGTMWMLRKSFAPICECAIQRLSGDQTKDLSEL